MSSKPLNELREMLREGLRRLNDLELQMFDVPVASVPETVADALGRLQTFRNAYKLTELPEVAADQRDYVDGKIEGIEIAIGILEGRDPKGIRSPKRPHAKKENGRAEAVRSSILPIPVPEEPPTLAGLVEFSPNESATLIAIARQGDRGCTQPHIALLTAYKARSIQNALSDLTRTGMIQKSASRYFLNAFAKQKLGKDYARLSAEREPLAKAEQVVLDTIASARAGTARQPYIALETKYKARSITNSLSSLKTRELIEKDASGCYVPTARGRKHTDKVPLGLTGAVLREYLKDTLPMNEAAVLEALETWAGNGGLTAVDLRGYVKYEQRSIQNALGALSTRCLIQKMEKGYALAADLYEES